MIRARHTAEVSGGVDPLLPVFVPPVFWLAVVLWRRASHPSPASTVVALGGRLVPAVVRQPLWGAAYGGNPPTLIGRPRSA